MNSSRLLALLLCCLALGACGLPLDAEQETDNLGSETPEEVVTSFFDSLNQALRDPQLTDLEVRRIWAGRLASYFAPSERTDQRYVLGRMLANYAADLETLESDQVLTLEVSYSGAQVVEQEDDFARVRLLDANLRFRQLQISEGGYRQVLRDQQRPLYEVLGQESRTFPVVEVNGRWFLTER